jgi:hypothetical protein
MFARTRDLSNISLSEENTWFLSEKDGNQKNFLNKLKTLLMTTNEVNKANHHILCQLLDFLKKIDFLPETGALLNLSLNCLEVNIRKIIVGGNIVQTLDKLIHFIDTNEKNTKESHMKSSKIFGVVDMKNPTAFPPQDFKTNNDENLKTIPKFVSKKCPNFDSIPRLRMENLPNRKIGKVFFILGKLDIGLRLKKILKYKLKLYRRRNNVPIIRKFDGRSKIAQKKARFRGRFVKQMKKIFSVRYKVVE